MIFTMKEIGSGKLRAREKKKSFHQFLVWRLQISSFFFTSSGPCDLAGRSLMEIWDVKFYVLV